MGRIIVELTVSNALDPSKSLETNAMVDTGATFLTLPWSMKERFGTFEKDEPTEIELADGSVQTATLCGPVKITIDQLTPIYHEVLFLPEAEGEGHAEPLVGYIPLEAARVAVDMLGHRLVPVKYADLK